MNENIIWTVAGKLKPGQRRAYEALMNEMMTEVIQEPGTTHYEWTIADDGETIHVYERYANAEAAVKHLATWSRFAESYMALVEVTAFTVFSDLTPELQAAVGGLSPIYMRPLGGFAK